MELRESVRRPVGGGLPFAPFQSNGRVACRILPVIYYTSDPSELTAADSDTTPDLGNQDLQMAREENHLVELEEQQRQLTGWPSSHILES